ncbi:MAG: FMN-binding protein [Lachnospiraceae bacterium]|nr:FMN-binding protein [Lachnospiraceae bacterium]
MNKIKRMFFLVPSILCLVAVIVGMRSNIPDFKSPELPKLNTVVKGQETVKQKRQKRKVEKVNAVVNTSKIKKQSFVGKGGYTDGVYSGEAWGYGGVIKALVTIRNKKINCIEVTDHKNETESYYKMAEKIIPRIIEAQSPNVDTVSGATYSSNGIKNAVIMALNKANGKPVIADYNRKNKSEDQKANLKTTQKGTPADGTFEGEAVCEKFEYTVKLKVKFLDGKAVAITSLKLVNNNDGENVPYCEKAWKPTIKNILKKQSDNVDGVSGATYSSNAIKDAYADARNKAIEANGGTADRRKKNGNYEKKGTAVMKNEELETGNAIKDGTYNVTVNCIPDKDQEFAPYHLSADVLFKDGKLISITNISSDAESNRKYYNWAAFGKNDEKGIVEQLLEKQSLNGLSAVSGATCSSFALRDLYIKAVKMAQGDSEAANGEAETKEAENHPVEETTFEKETENLENKRIVQTSAWVFAMEDEYGDYDFDDYELFANVLFENDVIFGIQIISCGDESNRFYCEKAANGTTKEEGMIDKMLRVGVDEADAVSGATCTSEALRTIYKKAMKLYKELFKNDENIFNENN